MPADEYFEHADKKIPVNAAQVNRTTNNNTPPFTYGQVCATFSHIMAKYESLNYRSNSLLACWLFNSLPLPDGYTNESFFSVIEDACLNGIVDSEWELFGLIINRFYLP